MTLDYPILESEIELKTYPELPAYNLDAAKQKIAAAGLAGQTLRLATIDTGEVFVFGGASVRVHRGASTENEVVNERVGVVREIETG